VTPHWNSRGGVAVQGGRNFQWRRNFQRTRNFNDRRILWSGSAKMRERILIYL
jgi:hypothetical protein